MSAAQTQIISRQATASIKLMRYFQVKIITTFVFGIILAAAGNASAQTPTPTPPEGDITISRAAAVKCLADADRVQALEAEIAVKNKAIEDLKAEITRLQQQFIEASTNASALKQQAVRDAAIIELLLKYARPKKIGIINF